MSESLLGGLLSPLLLKGTVWKGSLHENQSYRRLFSSFCSLHRSFIQSLGEVFGKLCGNCNPDYCDLGTSAWRYTSLRWCLRMPVPVAHGEKKHRVFRKRTVVGNTGVTFEQSLRRQLILFKISLRMRGHVTSHVILIDFVYFAKSFWWIKCSAPNFTDVLEATSELECSSFMAFNLHAVLTSPTSRCPYARPSFVTLGHFCVVILSLSSAIDVVSLHVFAAPSNLINTPRLKHLALDQSCTSSAEWSAWS